MHRLLLVGLLCTAPPLHADVFVLRHAETVSEGDDPGLSALGAERAAGLADLLAETPAAAVYSTDTTRTRATAAPLAAAAGVEVTLYDARNPGPMLDRVAEGSGHQVVVGHSNTVPALVHALGGDPGPDIDHSEYDRVYRLSAAGGRTRTELLRSDPVHVHRKPQPFPLDSARLRTETLVFRMSLAGRPAGTSRWQYRRDGEHIELVELTRLPDYDVDTTIRALVREDLHSGSISMTGTMFGDAADIEMQWRGRSVSGSSLMPRPPYRPQGEMDLDARWPRGSIERSAALMLAHAVPAADQARTFRWYNAYDGQFRNIVTERIGAETVSVPAGTFETDRLRYLGGAPSQIFYVTRSAPHRIVRIDIIAMAWRYELIEIVPE